VAAEKAFLQTIKKAVFVADEIFGDISTHFDVRQNVRALKTVLCRFQVLPRAFSERELDLFQNPEIENRPWKRVEDIGSWFLPELPRKLQTRVQDGDLAQ
jgi:hypothetical protein